MGMATQVKHTERLLMSPPYLVSFVFAGISQERTSYWGFQENQGKGSLGERCAQDEALGWGNTKLSSH